MSISIASDFPSIGYDGEPTFAGILQKYYVEMDSKRQNIGISRNWNENTTTACRYDYERRILPTLHSLCGKNTPAHELTANQLEQLLQTLADEHNYSDGTIEHYRHLILLVYQKGVEHDHFPDALGWEDPFDAETASDEEKEAWRINVKTKLRKSFSPEEEQRFVQWISALEPDKATGEDIGLMLMFTMGLRNNEACGANFSSIRLLDYHADTPIFDMLQSTKLNSAEVKSGGKTSNAPRTLLMMEPVYAFIRKRKVFIQQLVASGDLSLPENVDSVEDLPLVCKKLSFIQRASSNDLAAAGKALFNNIGIDRSELSVLFQILCSSEMQRMQIEEKEPTTYLFRRNCATHLYQLGFSPSEIQYWMGHEIEDSYTKRSFFADPDQIYALKEKWIRHPVLALLHESEVSEKNQEVKLPLRAENVEQWKMSISAQKGKELFICVDAQEPNCEISVFTDCNDTGMTASYRLVPKMTQYPRTAAISEAVIRAYQVPRE